MMDFNHLVKRLGVSSLVLFPLLNAQAASLTPEQALIRIQNSAAVSRIPGKAIPFELSYTETVSGDAVLFVFNKGTDGFVVASADDELPAVLGYSDHGAFNPKEISPQLVWWLGQYADEAVRYLQDPARFSASGHRSKTVRTERADIPEMLTTEWNQLEPYNLYCPDFMGDKSVTGCVATAMAQVIKYHSYPTQGSGQHSYTWNGRTLSFDYGAAMFDYQTMSDRYDGEFSAQQQQAVAELMYACGVSVNMNYSPVGSEAADIYIPYALKTYFNYDAGTRLLKRSSFTTEEWEDMVYAELAADRPVIYGGQAPGGGHQFVCDGYQDGYFHINWGWSGMGDGYFLLSALDPGLQGVGGFAGGYNSNQSMVCGARPSQEDSAPWYPIYSTGTMVITEISPLNIQANLTFKNGGVYNYSPEPVTLDFYLKIVSESGEEFLGPAATQLPFRGASGSNVAGFNGLPVYLPTGLQAGRYQAYLVFMTPGGYWQDVLFPLSLPSYLDLTVDADGTYTFAEGVPAVKSKIRLTEFVPQSIVVSGMPTIFNLSVENIGEIDFSDVLSIKVFAHGSRTEQLAENRFAFNLASGQTLNRQAEITYHLADGLYDVIAFDQYDEAVSDVIPLRIGEEPIAVERILLDIADETMKPGATLQLTATVLPDDAADKALIWSSSDAEVANVDQTGSVTAFTPGTAIITVKSASNEDISVSALITVEPIEAESVALDREEATLTEGDVLTLVAAVEPDDTTDKTLTWTSSDEEVATVEDGVVTALKPGTAVITVTTANGKSAQCVITVEARVIEAEGVTLDRSEATLTEGDLLTLVAVVEPDDTTDKTLTWTSSDEEVAAVEDGVVTALKPGTAVITVTTANGKSAQCVITVEARVKEAESVTLDREEATLTEGDVLTLVAAVEPDDTTDETLTWSSSDEEVATVEDGVVTALKPGTAVITVTTANGKSAQCVITVEARIIYVSSVTLEPTEISAVEGTEIRLTATVLPEDATDKTLIWATSDETVATVDSDGLVKILSAGSAVVTATSTDGSDIKAECRVQGISGINGVETDETEVDVYTADGLLVKKNASHRFVSELPKGVYIVRKGATIQRILK